MITEIRDAASGITRFEINTVRPDLCRMNIEKSGLVQSRSGSGKTVRYSVLFRNCEIDIISTETRTVLFSLNRYALAEFVDLIKGDELRGTAWIYDDSTRSDYETKL